MASVSLPGRTLAEASGCEAPLTLAHPAPMPAYAMCATVLSVLGVVSVWPTVLSLWSLWVTDPLKSIGAFVPVVSLVLILRVWRASGWEAQGSWWGPAVLAATAVVVAVRDRAVLELVLGPGWSITLPPHSAVAVAYASGVVLLCGGARLWRAAWFPVALMWFVNPVPHVFNRWVDLPLQHASAEVARGLAHTLGQRLTPDQLYLMFTPDFGMFIAPGCDGIRGSITMGLIALVAGYLYRFRLRMWAAVVGAAVLLGYVFNLLRLCVLVLYYVVALHWRWLQGHAEMGDYVVGATLFFCAAVLLFAAIRRLNADGTLRVPPVGVSVRTEEDAGKDLRAFRARWMGFALLVGLCAVPYARSRLPRAEGASTIRPAKAEFPQTVGRYRLERTWSERLASGQTIFEWAAYRVPGTEDRVQVGVSPVLGAHDTLLCHAARGEDWLWHGTLPFQTGSGAVSFGGTMFNDGTTAALEATTLCSGSGCGQWASGPRHLGLVYSRPDALDWADGESARPIPVILRVEVPGGALPAGVARARLTAQLQQFLQGATLVVFTAVGTGH